MYAPQSVSNAWQPTVLYVQYAADAQRSIFGLRCPQLTKIGCLGAPKLTKIGRLGAPKLTKIGRLGAPKLTKIGRLGAPKLTKLGCLVGPQLTKIGCLGAPKLTKIGRLGAPKLTTGPLPLPHGHEMTWPVLSPQSWVSSLSLFAGRAISLSPSTPHL